MRRRACGAGDVGVVDSKYAKNEEGFGEVA